MAPVFIKKSHRPVSEESLLAALMANATGLFLRRLRRARCVSRIRDECDNGLLHVCAMRGNYEAARQLLDQCGPQLDVNAVNAMGDTAVNLAIASMTDLKTIGAREIVRLLIEARADVFKRNAQGRNALHHAASATPCMNIVRMLYEQVRKVANDKEEAGRMLVEAGWPLLYSFWIKDFDITRIMVENSDNPAYVNHTDENNCTPLHDALDADAPALAIQLLLDHGADPNVTNHAELETPLHLAAEYNCNSSHWEILRMLLTAGADANARNSNGRTPFQLALKKADQRVAELFLRHGADVQSRDNKSKTALHFAASRGQLQVVNILLNMGAGVNETSSRGITALHVAARKARSPVVKLLLQRGAEINAVDAEGCSALFFAVQNCDCGFHRGGGAKTISTLLSWGADVDQQTLQHKTILGITVEQDNVHNGKLIIRHVAAGKMADSSKEMGCTLRLIHTDPCLEYFYLRCVVELDKLKQRTLYGTVSLYGALTASARVLGGYARNGELISALQTSCSIVEFPVYADLVAARLRKAARRQDVLRSAALVLAGYLQFSNLGHVVAERILDRLNNEDLRLLTGD